MKPKLISEYLQEKEREKKPDREHERKWLVPLPSLAALSNAEFLLCAISF